MATATPDRTALRRNVNCSGHLTTLRQKADRKIEEWEASGLAGDRKMAIEACKAVAAQASAENNQALAEEYDGKRVRLIG